MEDLLAIHVLDFSDLDDLVRDDSNEPPENGCTSAVSGACCPKKLSLI